MRVFPSSEPLLGRAAPVVRSSSASMKTRGWSRARPQLNPNRLAVAARVGAAGQLAAHGIDGDALRMTRRFVPVSPAIDDMAAPLELGARRRRKTAFDVQGVARLQEAEAAGQEAWRLQRLLDVEPVVDHGGVGLQGDLWLPVGPHAAQPAPQPGVPEPDPHHNALNRPLAGL